PASLSRHPLYGLMLHRRVAIQRRPHFYRICFKTTNMASSKKLDVTTPPDEEAFSIGRAKKAAWAIVALRPLRSAIGAVALLVLVRYLDEEDYGAYQIYYSIIAFLSMAASLGISNTVAR